MAGKARVNALRARKSMRTTRTSAKPPPTSKATSASGGASDSEEEESATSNSSSEGGDGKEHDSTDSDAENPFDSDQDEYNSS